MILTDAYYQARREAMNWLNSPDRKFDEGVNILLKSGYKPLVASKIAKWGDKPHSVDKLIYELRQMIQVWANPDDIDDIVDSGESDKNTGLNNELTNDRCLSLMNILPDSDNQEGDETQLPPVIRRLIMIFSEDYKSRSLLHKQLSELPEDNTEQTVRQRKTIVNSISALSDRMDYLYQLRRRYETDAVLPTEEDLNNKLYFDPDNDTNNSKKNETDEQTLPDDLDGLKKMRSSEGTKLTRAKNMLLYQQEAKPKDKKENPLPDSPKRVKYLKKVESLTQLIERIDYKIAELS